MGGTVDVLASACWAGGLEHATSTSVIASAAANEPTRRMFIVVPPFRCLGRPCRLRIDTYSVWPNEDSWSNMLRADPGMIPLASRGVAAVDGRRSQARTARNAWSPRGIVITCEGLADLRGNRRTPLLAIRIEGDRPRLRHPPNGPVQLRLRGPGLRTPDRDDPPRRMAGPSNASRQAAHRPPDTSMRQARRRRPAPDQKRSPAQAPEPCVLLRAPRAVG